MHLNARMRKWLPRLFFAAAVLITAIVYWPGATGGWVFDDYPNIVDNAAIHITPGHSTLAAWVNAALSSPASFLHRPLASITFALNWMQGGGNPWPFKVTNILIHLLNGVLLFGMLRALLRLMRLRAATSPRRFAATPFTSEGGKRDKDVFPAIEEAAATRLALIVSAAWMLLPINLMAVLYVVQRMESLCQVFVVAGLWAYLHGRQMMLTGRDRRGLTLATAGIVFGTVLGLTSKETAVLLPVFAFLAEWVVIGFRRNDALAPATSPHRFAATPFASEGGNPGGDDADAPAASQQDSERQQTRAERGEGDGSARHAATTLLPPSERRAERQQTRAERDEGDGSARHAATTLLPPSERSGTEGDGSARAERQQTHAERDEENDSACHAATDKRLWALFTITLFIPAALGFAWLLRSALNPSAWSGRDFTLIQRLLTEPRVLVDYLQWTLFPNPMVLSLYHDEIVKSTGPLAPWTTLGSMLLLAALIAIAVLWRKRRPLVALGIGWFFAAQLLTATIVPLELVYEQRMYFASIGVLMAIGALLLGVRWRIWFGMPRIAVIVLALLWFAAATNLRAREWSNPLRLAVAEANRHPESPRAVYEAGRLLLIASNYRPGATLTESQKYLEQAAAIPGASALSEQALIMIVDHQHHGDDARYWASMTRKLRDQPTRQEDISALISLTNCYGGGICVFNTGDLNQAYLAALSRPNPLARLNGAYADFQRDILHDDVSATKYLSRAVAGAPNEPAYRIDLAALYAKQGEPAQARQQIDALRRLNYAGRLDQEIATLEQMIGQNNSGKPR